LYFRGAVNPQGNDAVKGCLEFAEGKKLGERGLYWLKVQVANCAGYDKHSFDMRAKWTDDNLVELTQFALEPLSTQFAGLPTQYTLLAAVEALKAALELSNPEDYICTIPVAMDATCSGLQFYSAMFRDKTGGEMVNLTPATSNQKQDIYAAVGKEASKVLGNYTTDKATKAALQGFVIPRSMAKKVVMCKPYGIQLKSAMEYTAVEMHNDKASLKIAKKLGISIEKLSVPVAKALMAAVDTIVPAAGIGMDFLQNVVKDSSEAIKWVNPVGVRVCNWADVEEVSKEKVQIGNKEVQLLRPQSTGEYNKASAINGIAPNFIHSLDSSLLCMTVNAMPKDAQLMVIHDSFACHPSDVDMMQATVRSAFTNELFPEGVNLVSELLGAYISSDNKSAKPENMPAMGKLDLPQVIHSEFFFC
jgi:DNA-directed RNA polymerase